MKKFTKNTNRQTLAWFWRFTAPDKRHFYAANVLAASATLVQDILPPFVAAKAFTLIQQQYQRSGRVDFASVETYAWAYLGLLAAGFVLWRVQMVIAWVYEIRSQGRIYDYLFNHLLRQSSSFHADRFGGALVSSANKFAGAYERMMDELQWSITTSLTAFIASIGLLATLVPGYAAGLFVASIAYVALMAWMRSKSGHVDAELADSESQRTGKLADAITNISAIRSYANEKYEKQLFGRQIEHTSRAYFNLLKVVARNETAGHLSTAGFSAVSFVAGLLLAVRFNAPLGSLFLIINYTLALTRRLYESNRTIRNIIRAFGDARNMTEIFAVKPEITDAPGAISRSFSRGQLVMRNVDFSYGDKPVFRQLNLHIKPGEKIGLVGRSGGGKTTLTKLLSREHDITGGTIELDGCDIRSVKLASLRRAISLVPQEPLLFHRSIADNIGYGKLNASRREIEAVAKMANAHDFISLLPDGYDTLVGERGVKLSGGQRQRVAIARAMLKNAPVLILDEATSALDSESEVLIQDALWKLMEGKTALVIAHRLSTIQKMDRILVLEQGEIVEQGSHKELLKAGGVYAKLWTHQSGGFIED